MDAPVAFQGEPGAFGEDALRRHFGAGVEARAVPGFGDVFAAVRSGEAAAGVVPVENSTHGSVLEVYDLLLASDLRIVAEVAVPVRHCLLALPGVRLGELRRAFSHPQALAQSMPYLHEHGLAPMASYNTAGAARDVASAGVREDAAVASERAAGIHGLEIVARDIQHGRANVTRFVVLGREVDAPTSGSKATLVFTTPNEPGALHRALGTFAHAGVNLTRLESRPTGSTNWEYHFYVDCARAGGEDFAPASIAGLITALGDVAERVRLLGLYPAGAD